MKNLLISIFVLGVLICNNAYSIDAMQIQKILAGDAEDWDFFGNSVSISGDYAIVGAWGEDEGGTYAGAAYIYYRNQGGTDNWGEVKKLTAGDADAYDQFGFSVSISGDYAIVGAYGENSFTGAAYIFNKDQGSPGNWGEVKKLTASDAVYNVFFGWSVSILGDYAIVGAYGEDTGGSDAGAAYVFNKNQDGANNWGQVKKLQATDKQTGDQFGWSVSISGDYAIVGARYEDEGGSDAGAAYVFNKDQDGANNWGQVKKLQATDKQSGDWFGHSVSISGDYAIVGAYGEDTGGSNIGAAYVFNKDQGSPGNWGQVKKLQATDKQAGDWFGHSVSISGDYAVVGAMFEDEGGYDAGAAYIFNKDKGGTDIWGEVKKLTATDKQADDWFGYSVSISGDYAIVGARDEGDSEAGAAYMFQIFPSIPTLPEWGMIAMGVLFAGIGGWFVFRRLG